MLEEAEVAATTDVAKVVGPETEVYTGVVAAAATVVEEEEADEATTAAAVEEEATTAAAEVVAGAAAAAEVVLEVLVLPEVEVASQMAGPGAV